MPSCTSFETSTRISASPSRVKLTSSQVKSAKLTAQLFVVILENSKRLEAKRDALAEISVFYPFTKYQQILKFSIKKDAISSLCLKKFLEANAANKRTRECLSQELTRKQFLKS